MKVTIYVEGGGDNQDTLIRCKQGFAQYCAKIAPASRRPRIVACGGRQQAFDRFKTEVGRGKTDELCVLLVDAEEAVEPNASTVTHLHERDGWDFDHLPTQHIFLMVQAMEAWFLADRQALITYYGTDFRVNALPGEESHVEIILKADLERSLVNASRATKTKGQYHKTRHGFALLAEIDPNKVEAGSPHAATFHSFLRSL